MGDKSKYAQHILDPWLNPKIVQNFDDIAKYKNLSDEVWTNKGLADFGQREQEKIFGGKIGSTLLANTARTQGARDIAGLKASQRLGSAAMSRRGGDASSGAMNFLYDRMLKRESDRVNDRTAGMVTQGLPGYLSQSAEWAESGNKALAQKMGLGQAYQGMFSNAVQQRMSNQTFEKKKSLWDKIKEGVGFAGNLVGIASGIGAPFSMNSGGGQVAGQAASGNRVGRASQSGGYAGYY